MSYLSVFPITLSINSLEKEITGEELNQYNSFLDKETYIKNKYSNGTVNQKILDLDLFTKLKTQIFNYSKSYLDNLGHTYEDLQIINSWGTKTYPNQKSQKHIHNNSYISGVYYLTQGSNIEFYNPNIQNWFFVPEKDYNEKNFDSYNSIIIKPLPNLLLLFPSFLGHQIQLNTEDYIRKSISFNIIPKGEFGKNTSKLYL